jgi:hypothetical protein
MAMTPRRARMAAALVSCLAHAALLWRLAELEITQPADLDASPPVQVVLRQPPPPPPPRQAPPPPPPPAVAPPAPPPVAAPPPEPEPAAEPAAEKPPELEIPLPEQQIVAVPEGGREEPPPPDTRFLSDRDNRVEQQMVRQGEPAASREDGDAQEDSDAEDEGEGENREIAPPPAAERAAKPPLPGLRELLPDALALAARERELPIAVPTPAPPAGGGKRRVRRAEDWQPQTSLRGTLDYLPDVQPGHLTLLNTKADLFAPFVRRVMTRVFQNMLILLRRAAPSIRGGRERVQAEAVMDRNGNMIGITIQDRSTTMAIGLDRMLREACEAAFFDRNPPPGAESDDGRIHFVLETVIEAVPSGRGVEISGIFGVGLL